MERRLFLQAFKRFVCRQVIRFKSTGKMNCTGKNYICRANIDMHTRCNEYTHKKKLNRFTWSVQNSSGMLQIHREKKPARNNGLAWTRGKKSIWIANTPTWIVDSTWIQLNASILHRCLSCCVDDIRHSATVRVSSKKSVWRARKHTTDVVKKGHRAIERERDRERQQNEVRTSRPNVGETKQETSERVVKEKKGGSKKGRVWKSDTFWNGIVISFVIVSLFLCPTWIDTSLSFSWEFHSFYFPPPPTLNATATLSQP